MCAVCVFVVMKALNSFIAVLNYSSPVSSAAKPFPNELGQFLFSQSVEILFVTRDVPVWSSILYLSGLVCR